LHKLYCRFENVLLRLVVENYYLMIELTDQQIARQDYVDNAIYDLINELIASDKEMDWDIEIIGEVRDAVRALLVERGLCTEQEFYPYIGY